ncbi:uncharacterized protein LOC143485100 [Brachyhypopomus gauderio]|uniref:uncharacterized protein LOC143485100 n=1 Tax=Brachyhypopomus gauderio TaxID=698409 RepID=UPI0040421863
MLKKRPNTSLQDAMFRTGPAREARAPVFRNPSITESHPSTVGVSLFGAWLSIARGPEAKVSRRLEERRGQTGLKVEDPMVLVGVEPAVLTSIGLLRPNTSTMRCSG